MKMLASRFLEKVPDNFLFNWLILIAQSSVFHRNPFYPLSKGLNSYLLRAKIRSHNLSPFTDKIQAKIEFQKLLGKDITPKTLSVADDLTDISIPAGNWIFKSSHNCAGGVIYKDGTLSCAKRIVLKSPVVEPSAVEIQEVLGTFIRSSHSQNLFWTTREACYKTLEPRYFFEELLVDQSGEFFSEYKFHCIHGKVELGYLVVDRHGKNKRAIVSKAGELLNVSWCKKRDLHKFEDNSDYKIPKNWQTLISIAEKLSSQFTYVRVDLYTDENRVCIGELTFFHGSGVEPILPLEVDRQLGAKLHHAA